VKFLTRSLSHVSNERATSTQHFSRSESCVEQEGLGVYGLLSGGKKYLHVSDFEHIAQKVFSSQSF
jgi:hypothetical protein